MERIKSGISGLDALLDGGIPKYYNLLVAGLPGTGKTILGLQYLYEGAMSGENGVYVSLESGTDGIREQARQFGMDIPTLEKQGKLIILNVPMNVVKVDIFEMIEDAVTKIGARRLVFDSLDVFTINIDLFTIPIGYVGSRNKTVYTGESEKRITYLVISKLSSLSTTNLFIADSRQNGEQLTVDGVSEYLCDGVVLLGINDTGGEVLRTIKVMKLRSSKIDLKLRSFEFGDSGIKIEGD